MRGMLKDLKHNNTAKNLRWTLQHHIKMSHIGKKSKKHFMCKPIKTNQSIKQTIRQSINQSHEKKCFHWIWKSKSSNFFHFTIHHMSNTKKHCTSQAFATPQFFSHVHHNTALKCGQHCKLPYPLIKIVRLTKIRDIVSYSLTRGHWKGHSLHPLGKWLRYLWIFTFSLVSMGEINSRRKLVIGDKASINVSINRGECV